MNEYIAVRGLLSRSTALTTLIAGRLYQDVMPDNPTYPSVTYQKVDDGNSVGSTSNPGICWAILQVSTWSRTRLEAAAIVLAVSRALDRTRNVTVNGIQVDDCFGLNNADSYDSETRIYFTHSKFKIHYRET
ncbi:DUF3168 domain-containing protein [Rugamonas sp.]|uniref:DUF3168 domain-containing protein n=1 Tax=Rugamonas sp. TaxID=1926287 RepID=UPI0025FD1910|nr:DUF3168 domain-containing protein [Rugamonas sp.]